MQVKVKNSRELKRYNSWNSKVNNNNNDIIIIIIIIIYYLGLIDKLL